MPAEVLRVPASTQSLRLLAGYVAELADAASLSERDAYRLRLALDELFTNVVAYAYGDATGQVQLVGSTRDGLVELQIIDTGPAFDTVGHREPSRAQVSLSDRPLGGHGLALARHSADDLRYERVNGENRTTVVVGRTRLPGPARDVPRP